MSTSPEKQEVAIASPSQSFFFDRANQLHQQSFLIKVNDEQSESHAIDIGKTITDTIKELDADRRSLVDPLNKVVKDINARYKPYTDALKRGQDELRRRLLERKQEMQRIAQREAEARQAEMEAKALELAAERETSGDIIAAEAQIDRTARITVKPAAAPAVTGVITNAKASIQKKWKPRIIDLSALAKAYPDTVQVKESAIMALFRAGIKNIPGVEFYQEESVSLR